MLELKKIKKEYIAAGEKVPALKGVSLKFRKSEFVSILGPSGCGKTTLLNIIGGLDQYTDGDLVIQGVSTRKYKDGDWDTYRNHSIGFIFQSYHLIPHQTILQNVELALTIGGVPKKERRKRAIEALKKVGLSDKINARPNQLSGGQAQRVAIARALINDPEIVLADEPTGALDSKTSVQIMELLKEIAKDRLVIMVTHNPDLAFEYSTRIIRLLDGAVVDDSRPYREGEELVTVTKKAKNKGKKKNASMSGSMAFGLSVKNLMSKRGRTTLVSVAGSIGIVGVSLVLAISAGVQGYINSMQNDMLSGFPITIQRTALDYSALMDMSSLAEPKVDISKLNDKLYVSSLLETLASLSKTQSVNDINENYVDYVKQMPKKYYKQMKFDYGFHIANNIYSNYYVTKAEADAKTYDAQYASSTMSITAIRQMYSSILTKVDGYESFASLVGTMDSYHEIPNNYDYIMEQYEVVAIEGEDGKVSKDYTEEQVKQILSSKESLVLVADKSAVTDMTLAQFGYFSQEEFLNYAFYYIGDDGKPNENYNPDLGLFGSAINGDNGLDYSYFIGDTAKKFTFYPNDSIYECVAGMPIAYYKSSVEGGGTYTWNYGGMPINATISNIDTTSAGKVDLGVKLILQKKSGVSYGSLSGGLYYTEALTSHMLETSATSAIVNAINASESKSLAMVKYWYEFTYLDDNNAYQTEQTDYMLTNTGNLMSSIMAGAMGGGTMEMIKMTAETMGGSSLPTAIYIYPVDFDLKSGVTDYLDAWNDMCDNGETYTNTVTGNTTAPLEDGDKINYTDNVGLIIGLVNTMIEMVTIALICFTALSLVVSTVMIGIITYVSVVERIKEIGILRAVGARKKDIKRLFNAETFIIGMVSGIIGIAITYLVSGIINIIVGVLAGIYTIAALPWWQALIMIGVSVLLTSISGVIPASSAAKKDPVVALRTE